MVFENSTVRNAKELVNYLITEIIRHVQCVVEEEKRLVPRELAQFQTRSENYGYSGGDLTVLLIVLGDGFSPSFNLRSRS